MIDSGSPITIFTPADLGKNLKVDVIFVRAVPKNEQYVDYHNKPLNLLGFTTVEVQVGKKKLKNARILITRGNGKRSSIGRDWLNQLNFRVGEVKQKGEYNQTVNNINKTSDKNKDLEALRKKVPKLFNRKRKKGHNKKLS